MVIMVIELMLYYLISFPGERRQDKTQPQAITPRAYPLAWACTVAWVLRPNSNSYYWLCVRWLFKSKLIMRPLINICPETNPHN